MTKKNAQTKQQQAKNSREDVFQKEKEVITVICLRKAPRHLTSEGNSHLSIIADHCLEYANALIAHSYISIKSYLPFNDYLIWLLCGNQGLWVANAASHLQPSQPANYKTSSPDSSSSGHKWLLEWMKFLPVPCLQSMQFRSTRPILQTSSNKKDYAKHNSVPSDMFKCHVRPNLT